MRDWPAMVKNILVCLEGSASSERTAAVAIEIGKALNATLVGLAIVDEPDIRAGAATGIGGASYKKDRDEALLKDAHEHAQGWIDAFARQCGAAGVSARVLELRGRPEDTILEEMQQHDLTLLGRHVNFRFETDAQDRKTRDTVLQRAGKPVLVVPENPREAGPTVLAAFDGSSAAKRALRSFAESGLARDRAVQVTTVGDDGASAWEMAARGCELLAELGVKATPHSLVSTLSIADTLLERRSRISAGLMVLGAYAHSRVTQLLWGSVTRDLVEKTEVPLYLHH
jgi:nucleotide-binding universal stress UspA family protein